MRNPISVIQRREALLRRPGGISIMQIQLDNGAVPERIAVPSPFPTGGSDHYELVFSSPTRLEYQRVSLAA